METGSALVTGGSRGIGSGIVKTLAREGYDILFTYRTQADEAERVREEASAYGGNVLTIAADLNDDAATAALVGEAESRLGPLRLLVNNAGFPYFDSLESLDLAHADELYRMHFRGPAVLMREAASAMIRSGTRGSIVNITSSRASRAYPGDGAYGGMKAALERASQSFALDVAPHGIRVNCVAPGATDIREERRGVYDAIGPLIPLGRVGTPEDVAETVAWLASERASYITGITIRVDGGLILPGMPEDPDGAPWGRRPNEREGK